MICAKRTVRRGEKSPTEKEYDLVVLGSGAAGLTAAITVAKRGLRVLLLEKSHFFGGASAISGGAIWIPGNDQAAANQLDSSLVAAREYLRALIGDRFRPALVEAFLQRGSEALRFLEKETELAFKVRPHSPDYHPEVQHSSAGGRTLEVLEYDGRKLGSRFSQLRPPPAGMLLFSGMMVNRVDIQHFLDAPRSARSLVHCLRLMTRYARDRLRFSRGTRLTTGNALVGRLLVSANSAGVDLRAGVRVKSLLFEGGAVAGVQLESGEHLGSDAVVLATGGYGASPLASADRPRTDEPHWTMSPDDNIGDGLAFGVAAGGTAGMDLISNFFWAPVSVLERSNGACEKFPHLVTDRAKPGVLAINGAGRRFVNEANSYHRFVDAIFKDQQANLPCHLVCDSAALKAYGIGLARPGPSNNQELIKTGYLLKAQSLEELARRMGVPPEEFARSIERYNEDARAGYDTEFGKGSTNYNISMGDPNHRPNACLAPLAKPPFYAVRLFTGDLGSARGLVTDAHARVLRADGSPVGGLYAVGNDMNSIMEGTYPGPGITLGPALTFGYIAGDHIASQSAYRKAHHASKKDTAHDL